MLQQNQIFQINFFQLLYDSFLDVLAPRTCEVCGQLIAPKSSRFEFICRKCDLFMPSSISVDLVFNRFIENFQPDDIAINNAYGLFFVREDADYLKIIHGLKYNGFRRIGKEFGKELGNKLVKEVSLLYDGIVPVPIHHARLRERGFNQSEIIAESISEVLNVPVVKPIKRRIYTPTQTQLSKSERKVNLIDAIVPADNSMKLTGNFLLIDDVLTTGSTINECATIMLQMGAIRVDCAVLAVA